MKFLVDAVLPATLNAEAPANISFERWKKPVAQDTELISHAAAEGFRGVVFFGRNSLEQPGIRQLAEESGIALIAIDASDPIQARDRLLSHIERIRTILNETRFVLVLASEARPFETPTRRGGGPA